MSARSTPRAGDGPANRLDLYRLWRLVRPAEGAARSALVVAESEEEGVVCLEEDPGTVEALVDALEAERSDRLDAGGSPGCS